MSVRRLTLTIIFPIGPFVYQESHTSGKAGGRENRGPLKAVVSTYSLPGLQQGGWLTRHRHSGMFPAGIQSKSCVVSDS